MSTPAPRTPCPDNAIATLTTREAQLARIGERQECIGGHAAGEEHRSAQGMRWFSALAPAVEIYVAAKQDATPFPQAIRGETLPGIAPAAKGPRT